MNDIDKPLPLKEIRAIDLGRIAMGSTVGLTLAELEAEVTRVEGTPKGDTTRFLKGSGCGFFPFINHNKNSLCLNLKDPAGVEEIQRIAARLAVRGD